MNQIDSLSLQDLDKLKGMPKSTIAKDADWVRRCKVAQAKWRDHTTGNPYVLYVQNRTMSHAFRVQAYGKNPYQAVRRYYKGIDGKDNWTWQCTKVIAVYSCTNAHTCQAGDLLHGQAQDRAPW
tara:strand:+ start:96 stop:467 length:372 start_codon:yes stop_codon:yes gene_type:complete